MKELPKIYDPKAVESKIYDLWMEGGYFHAERDPERGVLFHGAGHLVSVY